MPLFFNMPHLLLILIFLTLSDTSLCLLQFGYEVCPQRLLYYNLGPMLLLEDSGNFNSQVRMGGLRSLGACKELWNSRIFLCLSSFTVVVR